MYSLSLSCNAYWGRVPLALKKHPEGELPLQQLCTSSLAVLAQGLSIGQKSSCLWNKQTAVCGLGSALRFFSLDKLCACKVQVPLPFSRRSYTYIDSALSIRGEHCSKSMCVWYPCLADEEKAELHSGPGL